MQPKKPNTPNRDNEYGTNGDALYDVTKSAIKQALAQYGADEVKKSLPSQLKNIMEDFDIPNADKVRCTNAATEAAEDAFLEAHLPSPFPQKAVQKPKATNKKS